MKTSVINVGKGVGIGLLAMFLLSCGDKNKNVTPQTQAQQVPQDPGWTKLTQDPSEPKWLNHRPTRIQVAGSPVSAIGSAPILNGNVQYAINKASLQARNLIASQVETAIRSSVAALEKDTGSTVDGGGVQGLVAKVNQGLNKSEIMVQWIDKTSNPNNLWVLVSMDKDAFDQALKGGTSSLKIDQDGIKKFNDTLYDTLNRGEGGN